MMRKYLIWFVVVCAIFIIPRYAHADTVMPSNEILEEYDLSVKMVEEAMENLESINEGETFVSQSVNTTQLATSSQETDKEISDKKRTTEDTINDFGGILYLNKGFSKKLEPTFAQQKILSGEGEEGTSVLLMVYHNDDEKQGIVTYESEQIIGASGIYSENFELEYIGMNYILIYATKDDVAVARIYRVNRKEQETKDKLESFQYNAAKDKKGQQTETPTVQEILQQLEDNNTKYGDINE